jgi:hypothetical protein
MITHPQEEYLVRHNLKNVDLIRQVELGHVFFFRTVGRTIKWTIFSIYRQNTINHPWEYKISYQVPVHNGYKDGRLFEKSSLDALIQYEEYEDFVYRCVTLEHEAVIGKNKAVLACWQMFLVQYDGWLLENASLGLKKLIFNSIDSERSIVGRLESYSEAVAILKSKHPSVGRRYEKDVLFYSENYCDWLAAITNGKDAIELYAE